MNSVEILNVPRGMYRVFGRDNFDKSFFIVDDYENLPSAIAVARAQLKHERKIHAGLNEVTASFYVADDKKRIKFPEIRDILK